MNSVLFTLNGNGAATFIDTITVVLEVISFGAMIATSS